MKRKKNYLGDKIYDWRKQNEVSQEDFADMVGVSRQSILNWEAGVAMPKADKLKQISDIIGMGLDQLMSDPDAYPLAEVVADEVVQESEATKEKEDRKFKLSPKAKIAIATTVIVFFMVIGIALIVFDRFLVSPYIEDSLDIATNITWNFSMENIGWALFGISTAVGVILGVILICKFVKSKKKEQDDANGVEP